MAVKDYNTSVAYGENPHHEIISRNEIKRSRLVMTTGIKKANVVKVI